MQGKKRILKIGFIVALVLVVAAILLNACYQTWRQKQLNEQIDQEIVAHIEKYPLDIPVCRVSTSPDILQKQGAAMISLSIPHENPLTFRIRIYDGPIEWTVYGENQYTVDSDILKPSFFLEGTPIIGPCTKEFCEQQGINYQKIEELFYIETIPRIAVWDKYIFFSRSDFNSEKGFYYIYSKDFLEKQTFVNDIKKYEKVDRFSELEFQVYYYYILETQQLYIFYLDGNAVYLRTVAAQP